PRADAQRLQLRRDGCGARAFGAPRLDDDTFAPLGDGAALARAQPVGALRAFRPARRRVEATRRGLRRALSRAVAVEEPRGLLVAPLEPRLFADDEHRRVPAARGTMGPRC